MDYSKLSDDEINLLVVQQRIKYGHFTTDQKDTSGKRYTSGGWDWGKGTGMGLFDRNGAEHVRHENGRKLDYCNNPADAWPIIFQNGISMIIHWDEDGESIDDSTWTATTNINKSWCDEREPGFESTDTNPLRAAMIVFLMMQESE